MSPPNPTPNQPADALREAIAATFYLDAGSSRSSPVEHHINRILTALHASNLLAKENANQFVCIGEKKKHDRIEYVWWGTPIEGASVFCRVSDLRPDSQHLAPAKVDEARADEAKRIGDKVYFGDYYAYVRRRDDGQPTEIGAHEICAAINAPSAIPSSPSDQQSADKGLTKP